MSDNARGGGTGRALLGHVRSWAEASGAAQLYWRTSESNAPARALYDQIAVHTNLIHYQVATLGGAAQN